MEKTSSDLLQLSIGKETPQPLYGGQPFPKSAKKCKRCRMPSELRFCMMCQFEFSMMAKLCFDSIDLAISTHQEAAPYELQRAAYRAAKKRMKHVLSLKSYGVTFEETREYRKRLKALQERLKIEKDWNRVSLQVDSLEASMSAPPTAPKLLLDGSQDGANSQVES
ncbi:hypothetical protein [Alicyclobacillus acidiphilus]|uniref:hypothetical protein n=1 Tax=Alicyclobacillus acidiphilus TaxID=182455 RepID=UPI000AF63369|nr:hypothetical protein [Alicyclobacillus acidiphilus]